MLRNSVFPGDILTDLRSSKALAGINIGLVISLMAIVIQISLAAMIFSGPLEAHAQRGMGLSLAGAVVLLAVTALFSGFRSNINLPQDAPVAIFAGAAAGIAATLGMGHTEAAFITVVAALMLSTLATAAFLLLVAKKKLADYVRLMPYPVVAGFLAGTGWLLTKGSLEVMTGMSLSLAALPSLLSRDVLPLWVPGAVYAGLLFFSLRRWSHFLILPGSMVVALILYHATLPLLGLDMAQARENGLFFASSTSTHIWPPFTPTDLQHVQWAALAREIPTLAIIPFIALLGLLLNTGGIELASRRDLDLNRELRVNGYGNALAALAGSHAGYSALSLSMLGFKTGADTRIVGLTAALVLAGILLFGSQILSIYPKALLGGFLLLIGVFFLSDWIVDTRKHMPRPDYVVVLAVFGTIGVFGYLHGVLLGLLATVALFTAKISRIPAVEAVSTMARTRGRKARPIPHQHILNMHGHGACLFKLNGFLFFGSVNSLTTSVMNAVQDDATRFVLVDFQNVSGFDVSAVNNFVRLTQRMQTRNVALVLAAPPDLFTDLLTQIGGQELTRTYKIFHDGNAALEWCEDEIIRSAHIAMDEQSDQTKRDQAKRDRDELFDTVADELLSALAQQERVESLLDAVAPYLESRDFPPGETFVSQGDLAPGMMFVQEGAVLEQLAEASGGSTTLRTLGPGTFFNEPAAYGPWRCFRVYRAESPARIAFLTPEALRNLERDAPETALAIHHLVVEVLVSQPDAGSRPPAWHAPN